MRIGYARLSTREQAEGIALEQQVKRLVDAGCDKVLTDLISGSVDRRPSLDKALGMLEDGQATELVITRLDRLTRSASYNCYLAEFFGRDNGPRLRALDDAVDTTTVMGRAAFRMIGVFAQAEVERIRERSSHGIRHRREVLKAAQGRAPFGFKRERGDLFLALADAKTVAIALGILERFIATADARGTCGWLHKTHGVRMSARGLKNWLVNPALVGDTGRVHPRPISKENGKRAAPKPGWLGIDPDTHPPLISRAKQAEVLRALEISKRTPGGQSRGVYKPSWASSRFRCSSCGHRMTPSTGAIHCPYETCGVRYKLGSAPLSEIRHDLLRGLFWIGRGIAHRLAAEVASSSQMVVESPEIQEIRAKIASLKSTGMAEVEPLVKKLETEITQALQSYKAVSVSEKVALQTLVDQLGSWEGLKALTDEELLKLCRDAEIEGVVERRRVRLIVSKRWQPLAWSLDADGSDLIISIGDEAVMELVRPSEEGADPGCKEEDLGLFHFAKWMTTDPKEQVFVMGVMLPEPEPTLINAANQIRKK
ncbi:MAG: recombinase family protein [Cyanobacteria bacterium]|nr:recombinase family protein [Cyanobacteriota bacterium]